MRKHWIAKYLLLAGALAGPLADRAMAQWDVSGNPSINTPLPLGPNRADMGAIYFGAEFLFMHPDRPIGSQVVGARGFVDTDGSITGTPGQFVGSRRIAMTTSDFGRTSWTPGYRATIGYRMEDGTSISISYAQFEEVKYAFSAGPIPPDFNTGSLGADTFLFAPVFGFSPQFSGPGNKLGSTNAPVGSGSSPYGIWNGATTMSEQFIQRFTNWDFTARSPVYESEYARSYALAGGRFAWFWDEYKWDVASADQNGGIAPEFTALYRNIMSQRMYGPLIGVGNEIYLGNAFAMSADLTGAALLNVIKERAFYALGDGSTVVKRARSDYSIVPNVNATVNLWWYPIEGVQVRLGYDIYTFFNSQYMQQPVGFNAGAPDPSYKTLPFRMLHGFHVGVAYSF